MQRKIIYTFILSMLILPLMAQLSSVSGWVYDSEEQMVLMGANVILRDSTGNMRYAAVSDTAGFFSMEEVQPGNYTLQVSYIGYASYKGPLSVPGGKQITLGRINIGSISATLEEVQVTAKIPPVQTKGDTTEFNADAFKTAPNALAEQLVRKMPGMELGRDGTVTAQGEQVQRVLVDGKPFFGDDPSVAMKNLPADVIDRVQVFDQLSEQSQFTGFDDGNRIRTMNIITRVEKKEGTFGRLYGGYGTDGRYEAGGTTHLFDGAKRMAILGMSNNINDQNFATQDILNALGSSGRSRWGGRGGFGGGIGTNSFLTAGNDGINTTHSIGGYYTNSWKEKTEFTMSYFGNLANNENVQNVFRDFLLGTNAGQTFDQTDIQERRNTNHRIEMRLDHKFNDDLSILYTPSFRWQDTRTSNVSGALTTSETGEPINSSDVVNQFDRSGWQWNNRLLIRNRFAKKGRTLSVNLQADIAPGEGLTEVFALNTFTDPGNVTDTLTQDQQTPFSNDRFSFRSNVNYTEPVGEKGQLQLQYELGYNTSNEEQLTYIFNPLNEDYDQLSTILSSDLNSQYTRHVPGVSYRHSINNWNLSGEIEAQWARLNNELILPNAESVSLDFFNWLPSINIQYRKSRSNQFRLSYRTSTDEPSVSQLQSAIDNRDPLNVSSGNPNLKQEYQHRFIARYSQINAEKGFNLFAFAFLQLVNDRISNQRIISDGTLTLPGGYLVGRGGQFTQPVNLDGYYSLRSYFSAGKPFFKQKLNVNGNLSFRMSNDPSLLDQQRTNTINQTIQPGLTLSSNISEKTDFALSASAGFNSVNREGLEEDDVRYTSWTVSGDLTQFITPRWYVQTDVAYFRNVGLSDDFDAPWLLWRASTGVLLFPKKQAEIRLFWFDISRQNDQIQRIISDIFVEDQQNTVLEPYFMLRFTWFMNAFNAGKQEFGPDRSNMNRFGPPRR